MTIKTIVESISSVESRIYIRDKGMINSTRSNTDNLISHNLVSIWSSPSTNNREIFIGFDDCFLYSFDLNGNLNWKTMLEGKIRSTPSLMKSTNSLFIGTHNDIIYCIDRSDGYIKWKYETGGKIWSSPAITKNEGILLVGSLDSHIYSLDVETGRVNWKFPTMDSIELSPCSAKNMLFIDRMMVYCIVLVFKENCLSQVSS